MTLKREIKDAYIENGDSIYIKTHGDAVYIDENETETLTQRLDNVKNSIAKHTSQLNENTQKINAIEKNGVTTEVVEKTTKDYLDKKIADGTLDDLVIKEDSITWDKFNIYLKTNINKMAINTKIEGNLIKETYFDNTLKITDISDVNNIIEKWYDNTGNNILFQRKTTINIDGSISESLIENK